MSTLPCKTAWHINEAITQVSWQPIKTGHWEKKKKERKKQDKTEKKHFNDECLHEHEKIL